MDGQTWGRVMWIMVSLGPTGPRVLRTYSSSNFSGLSKCSEMTRVSFKGASDVSTGSFFKAGFEETIGTKYKRAITVTRIWAVILASYASCSGGPRKELSLCVRRQRATGDRKTKWCLRRHSQFSSTEREVSGTRVMRLPLRSQNIETR